MSNPWAAPATDEPPFRSGAPGGLLWALTSFEGRIPRRTYWLGSIGSAIVFYAFAFAAALALPEEAVMIVLLLLYVPLLWVSLALQVKRWHDRDRSGWFWLVALIPIVGPIWAFVECGCLRGTFGRNAYGADPT